MLLCAPLRVFFKTVHSKFLVRIIIITIIIIII